jgi:hypothetical protein
MILISGAYPNANDAKYARFGCDRRLHKVAKSPMTMPNKPLIAPHTVSGVTMPPQHSWAGLDAPPDWTSLPLAQRRPLLFLDLQATAAVYAAFEQADLLCGDDGWGNTPFSGGCFVEVARCHQQTEDWPGWLQKLPVPAANPTLWLPVFASADEPAVLTNWQVTLAWGDSLFAMDNLVVVDVQANWCLYYHHDGVITFAHQPAI